VQYLEKPQNKKGSAASLKQWKKGRAVSPETSEEERKCSILEPQKKGSAERLEISEETKCSIFRNLRRKEVQHL
jgi:hypothetical protein